MMFYKDKHDFMLLDALFCIFINDYLKKNTQGKVYLPNIFLWGHMLNTNIQFLAQIQFVIL